MHQAQKSLALQPLLMKGHLLELDQALQPYVLEAATVRVGGCDRACQRLRPRVLEAATVRVRGCDRCAC